MIVDDLCQITKDMKELQKLETIQANVKEQDHIDRRYEDLVNQIHQFVKVMNYLWREVHIGNSEFPYDDITSLLDELAAVTQTGLANNDLISKVDKKYQGILSICKKIWQKIYFNLTSDQIGTLKVIYDLDKDKVNECMRNIEKASKWNTDLSSFKDMMTGLAQAGQLIDHLGLSPDIIEFLQKMNQGKATLADLNENILIWVENGNLEKRIKLSFSVGYSV